MILNETPVRTSKNFNINNIKLENINIPEKIGSFTNVKITECINTESEIDDFNLTYGLGNDVLNQVKTKANQKLKLIVEDKQNKENEIEFRFDNENVNLVDNIEIIANKNTKSTIIIKYKSLEEIENFHNGVIRLFAKKGSEINVIVVNLMNEMSNNFISIENTLEENTKINYTIIDFGGKNSITNYYSNLTGDFSDNTLNTIYLGNKNQLFDLNYIGELRGKKSNIDIEVQGALTDSAKKHFKGTIDFKKGCKKATGNENETCLLLSDTAKSMALPMLLCSEEDIEGNHSSSCRKSRRKRTVLYYE